MVPFLLLLVSFSFSKLKVPLKEPNVPLGFVVMFISIVGLFRQGIAGEFFWLQIITLFGQVATFFIFMFSFIVGFVVLFDTDIKTIIKFLVKVFQIVRKYTIGSAKKLVKEKKSKQSSETGFPDTIS